jgi:hypothetical protein
MTSRLNQLSRILKEAGLIKESFLVNKLVKSAHNAGELVYLNERKDNADMDQYVKQMLSSEGYRPNIATEEEEPARLTYRDVLIMRLDDKLTRYLLNNQDEVNMALFATTDDKLGSLDEKKDNEYTYSDDEIKEILYTDRFYKFFNLEEF